MEQQFTKSGFVRSYVVPALLMFAIPLLGYWFGSHVQHTYDAEFLENVSAALRDDTSLAAAQRGELDAFYRAHPASALCAGNEAERNMLPTQYIEQRCGAHAQMSWITRAARYSGLLGLVSLLFVLGCAGVSFISREWQFRTFLAGWHFLRATSALQVLAQGFLVVMLSYWLTAYFFHIYILKLIAIAAVAAVVAAVVVIRAIFHKVEDKLEVEGEPLAREASPALWSRIDALSQRLGTAPPQHILGGIDNNFFVTEHAVHIGERVFQGRSLFVSLSLLKRLDKQEADAILAHELAHFSGGDTEYSKRLAPLLSRYRSYMLLLYQGVLSRVVFYFMLFYWSMMQLSFGRESRERELRADKIAADTTSPEAVGHALLKVAAYSCYRARFEQGLFDKDRAHSNLNIAHGVAVGFVDYARGQRLASDLEAEQAFPHPFDSHPSLAERCRNVGWTMPSEGVADIVADASTQTWFNEIGDAERIEAELWRAYEARFKAAHDESLAYRYLPANDNERALVERYFPPVTLDAKPGKSDAHPLQIDCETLRYGAWDKPVAWASITTLTAEDKAFRGKVLSVAFTADGAVQKHELRLDKLAEKDDAILQVLGRYYTRVLAAKQHIADSPDASPSRSA